MAGAVVAFYYDWYGNPEFSGQWRHWNECHYTTRDPARVDAQGYRDLGAAHNPVLGPYDSLDPRVVENHIGIAEDVGLDAFAVTWWGQRDTRFENILDRAGSSQVRAALYWEVLTNSDRGIDGAVEDILWVLDNYGDRPGYWRIDGRPVLYVYRRTFTQLRRWNEWREALRRVRERRDAFFIADTSAVEAMQTFDGYHITTSVLQVLMGDDMKKFHQLMKQACQTLGKLYAAPVIPGFDNARVHEKGRLVTDRLGGKLYEDQWEAALACAPDHVMINSFNEWHEGSEIEPSLELGDAYLNATRQWIARYKGQ